MACGWCVQLFIGKSMINMHFRKTFLCKRVLQMIIAEQWCEVRFSLIFFNKYKNAYENYRKLC